VHASLWRFQGDPDDLVRRYDELNTEFPAELMRLQLCLRADDGIVVVDTCPDRETFLAFAGGEAFAAARRRHGLPDPIALEDFPVHAAYVDGAQRVQ
jgi:hypothetical protein